MGDREQWYWDLTRQIAVPASERGRGDHTMGPYESKAEAENWRKKVEARNESWDESNDTWTGNGDSDDT